MHLVGPSSRGCASLHPGLYAVGPLRGLDYLSKRLSSPSCQLLNADLNEFGELEVRETYFDVEYSRVDVILSGSCSSWIVPTAALARGWRTLERVLLLSSAQTNPAHFDQSRLNKQMRDDDRGRSYNNVRNDRRRGNGYYRRGAGSRSHPVFGRRNR